MATIFSLDYYYIILCLICLKVKVFALDFQEFDYAIKVRLEAKENSLMLCDILNSNLSIASDCLSIKVDIT